MSVKGSKCYTITTLYETEVEGYYKTEDNRIFKVTEDSIEEVDCIENRKTGE